MGLMKKRSFGKSSTDTKETAKKPTNSKPAKSSKFAKHTSEKDEKSTNKSTKDRHLVKSDKKKNKEKNKGNGSGAFDMYVDMISNKISGGYNEKPPELADNEIRTGLSTVYTRGCIKKILIIKEYPEFMEKDFMETIRTVAGDNVQVIFYVSVEPYKPNPKNKVFMRKMRQFANAYDDMNQAQANSNTEARLTESDFQAEVRKVNSRMVNSYKFIKGIGSTTGSLAKMYIVVEVVRFYLNNPAVAQEELRDAVYGIERYATYNGIKLYKPFMNVLDYLRTFNICSLIKDSLTKKIVVPTMTDDKSLAKFYSFNQGEVRGEGVYVGTDIMTQIPVHRQFLSTTGAKNIFLVAQSGKGKSFYFKGEIFYFLSNGYRIAMVDFEGDEYTAIGEELGAKILSFSVNKGYYFDTTEIGALTGDEEIDKDLYSEAVHATEHIFSVLLDPINEMSDRQAAIFGDAIVEMYKDVHVFKKDRASWKNSADASFKKIFEKISVFRSMKNYGYYKDEYEQYAQELDNMYDTLRRYFGETGAAVEMFENRLSINEIESSDFLIFSFGMKGAGRETMSQKDLALRQSCVAYLITLYANYNKTTSARNTLGRDSTVGNGFTVIAFEEVQRYWETKGAAGIISDVITGSRKRHAICYLISNSPLSIIKALSSSDSLAVKENITTVIIGRMQESTCIEVAKTFDIESCIPQLSALARNSKYNHCFLAAFDKEDFSVVKMDIAPEIANSPYMETVKVVSADTPDYLIDNDDYAIESIVELANVDFKGLLSKVSKEEPAKETTTSSAKGGKPKKRFGFKK